MREGGCRSIPCEQIKVRFVVYTYITEPLALNGYLHSCFPGAGARPFAKPHGALPREGVCEVTYAKAPARYVGDVGDSEEEPEVGRREIPVPRAPARLGSTRGSTRPRERVACKKREDSIGIRSSPWPFFAACCLYLGFRQFVSDLFASSTTTTTTSRKTDRERERERFVTSLRMVFATRGGPSRCQFLRTARTRVD